ncbi:MAG: hypothetical protein GX197_00715 [Firmicutes bacterium]|nr:hypothetical protein [Bacillota bacterium]
MVQEKAEGIYSFTIDTEAGKKYLESLTVNSSPADGELNAYAFPQERAAGFYAFARALQEQPLPGIRYIKGQITGPLTMGLMIKDLNGKPSFCNDVLREILTLSLALQIRWQVRYFRRLKLPLMLFIDEPGLYAVGKKDFAGLTRRAVQDSLNHLITVAHEEGAEVGIHTCAGTDWSLLFALPFELVNVDIYHFFPSLLPFAAELDAFLRRGGTLAWGLIPTSREVQAHTAESLGKTMQNYREKLEEAGVDGGRLKQQCLLTPSCGAGTLTDEEVRAVYRLLQEVSEKILAKKL